MAKVNLTQGAKLAGVSRSTIMRDIQKGKITKGETSDGKPCLDTSEIQRVYGDLSQPPQLQTVAVKQPDTPDLTLEKTVELAVLKNELENTKERLVEVMEQRDEWMGVAKSSTAQLADLRSKDARKDAQTGQGAFNRFFRWVRGR